jgi:hypothetical protein
MLPGHRLSWPLTLLFLAGTIILLTVLPLWLSIPASLGLGAAIFLLQPWLTKPHALANAVAFVCGSTGFGALTYVIVLRWDFFQLTPQALVFVLHFAGSCLLALSLGLVRLTPSPARERAGLAGFALLGGASFFIISGVLITVLWDYWEAAESVSWLPPAVASALGVAALLAASANLFRHRIMNRG